MAKIHYSLKRVVSLSETTLFNDYFIAFGGEIIPI